ncbi:MAG: hypothetical protein JNJ89_14425 [Rubrivivax sp.]|nr:hypothetical protein [Rubrivivax sp.]
MSYGDGGACGVPASRGSSGLRAEVRDAAWQAMMDDPRVKRAHNPVPLDGRRMIHGGLRTIAES